MACLKSITADIIFDCGDKPKRGIAGSRAVIINHNDIDWTTTTTAGSTVSNLGLKSGSQGYSIEWFKELGSTAVEYVPNEEDFDGFRHSFLCRLGASSAENAERASELKNGRFIIVVETNYKGAENADAFKVYGLEMGMELAEMTGNSNENSGSLLFTLSTKETDYEEYPYQVLLETDYEATKASFEAMFATTV